MTIAKLSALCMLAASAPFSLAQISPLDDFVLSGPTAYGMLPPEPVAGGTVRQLAWSDDGNYLIAVRDETKPSAQIAEWIALKGQGPGANESIVIYSMIDRKQTVAWKMSADVGQLIELQWFKGSDTALAVVAQRMRTVDPGKPSPTQTFVLFIDAKSGTSQRIYAVDQVLGEPGVSVSMSPVRSLGLIVTQQFGGGPGTDVKQRTIRSQYRVAMANGSVSPPVDIDSGASPRGWTPDGTSAILAAFGFDQNGKLWRATRVLELASGTLSANDKAVAYVPRTTPAPISVGPGDGTVTATQKQRRLHPWWLINDKGDEHAMVNSDATQVALSPTLSGVAYVSQGVAMVRPIIQVPKDQFLLALKAAERTQIMNRAKQVALGLLMYSSDMDDTLPSSQADIANLIAPYLKDSSLTSGFVYTFGGGLLTDVKDPATTIMGYIGGSGGKAVVYLDGHVKWQNDQ